MTSLFMDRGYEVAHGDSSTSGEGGFRGEGAVRGKVVVRSCHPRPIRLRPLMVAAILAAASPAVAYAKNVLVIGTHPDDEVLLAAGRTRTAFVAGDQIKVVVVTNGDIAGVEDGLRREGESVDSAQHLGLSEPDVIFMGFPDSAMMDIHSADTDTTLITSAAGQTATYGNRGMGGMDYHRFVSGVPGPYTRATVRGDFETLFKDFQPDEIYTHSDFEWHNDHQATAMFITEALASLRRQGVSLGTKLYQSVVWMPTAVEEWPQLDATAWSPTVPFLPDSPPCTPGQCLDQTPMEWKRLIHFAQPPEMLATQPTLNMKGASLPFDDLGWFGSFVRKDEFFWQKDFGTNLAITASVSASSEDASNGLLAAKAVDGIIKGFESGIGYDWVTLGELVGAWIQLDWPAPVRVAQVNLWNQPNTGDEVQAGTLLFSDGTQVAVQALSGDGRVLPVRFAPKTVSWVRFRVDQAQGSAVGLAEIQVLGAPASSTANLSPHFVEGPWPTSRTVAASQSTPVSVVAGDLDGDPLTYQWSAEAGTVTGSGASVVYTAPPVSAATWFTVSVTVSDGRGGSASNSTYVEVTPSASDSIMVSPTTVFAGDSATGSIGLAAPAPTGGTTVALTNSSPSVVTVPASVTVPAGASGATFPVTTAPATAATSATITAAFAGGARSATLSLVPRAVASLALAPAEVVGGIPSLGTVTLPAPAGAAGAAIQLTSSDPAAAVPGSVTVPAGASTATFTISTSVVAMATAVTLSATWGTTATAVLTVSPQRDGGSDDGAQLFGDAADGAGRETGAADRDGTGREAGAADRDGVGREAGVVDRDLAPERGPDAAPADSAVSWPDGAIPVSDGADEPSVMIDGASDDVGVVDTRPILVSDAAPSAEANPPGPDARTPEPETGGDTAAIVPGRDAGAGAVSGGGCSCTVGSARQSAGWPWLLVALGLLVGRLLSSGARSRTVPRPAQGNGMPKSGLPPRPSTQS